MSDTYVCSDCGDTRQVLCMVPGPPPTTPGKVTHYLVQWSNGEYGLVYYTGMCWALRSLTSRSVDDAIAHARLPGSNDGS